jgi:hypothetical protein
VQRERDLGDLRVAAESSDVQGGLPTAVARVHIRSILQQRRHRLRRVSAARIKCECGQSEMNLL